MPSVLGVHLLPSTGEFTYDTIPYNGARAGYSGQPLNTFYAPGGAKTDYSYAIDQLQAAHPECTTVSIVCSWFCDGLTAGSNHVYPSTTFPGGSFSQTFGGADNWVVSSLNQNSAGLIAIPSSGQTYAYGGTPTDQSVVRCIRDLKSRGFKVVFYPFLLMTASGYPWRGEIGFTPDVSSAATSAVDAFLGSAATSQFAPDDVNLTVNYSGPAVDYTYRRMILHYAWLCTVAGGVNLFVIGSELRGLETIRGPNWTPAGTVDSNGHAIWDYPFVAGLQQLADDVRSIFDSQGLPKSLAGQSNLVAYSADWSDWMGYQHPGANGQWPHLDALWASANIDVVAFDNYLPLSDWTTGAGGLDAANWLNPAPAGAWPPALAEIGGLGLSGPPTIYSKPYLKANIEGGEKFDWYYNDSVNGGRGRDPAGTDLIVSLPAGDRLAQARKAYDIGQQILANKQLRWWWNNPHQAIYDAGAGWIAQGPSTAWQPQSKSIVFLEYGAPACDKGTNQPNVFFDAALVQSATPYWSIWQPTPGGGYSPQRDDTIASLALQSIYEYWNVDGNNETSYAGVAMVLFSFCCVWNWDARPFPAFPILSNVWGDAGNWATGDWLEGRGPAIAQIAASADPAPDLYPSFPTLAGLGWSSRVAPRFGTAIADRVSGRSVRRASRAFANYDIELTAEILDADAPTLALEQIAGFFEQVAGAKTPFWFAPPDLAGVAGQALGTGDGATTTFPLLRSFGSYVEPVAGSSGVTAVYLSGTTQSAATWSLVSPFSYAPSLLFTTPPPVGATISADFAALWLCRFADDVIDLEEFMTMLFELQVLKLRTVRP